MPFEFATATQIIFGKGVFKDYIGTLFNKFGKHALVVVGKRNPLDEIKSVLDKNQVSQSVCYVDGEPTVEEIIHHLEFARSEGCDVVISLGGGSVIDTGKAVAGLLTNPGEVLDYLEVIGKNLPLQHAAIPFIAVPTTAGTGSEVTRNAVLGVPDKRVKVSLRSLLMLPKVALVDPVLSSTMPPEVTASTGLDALCQVLEPFVSNKANPMVDLFCREGMRRASSALLQAYQNGNNLDAREEMSLTSLLGGLCLANAGLGAVHGFAGPIGGMFKAPHGMICACMLPAVFAANVNVIKKRFPDSSVLSRFTEVSKILCNNNHATVYDGTKWLEDIIQALNVPKLAVYGITKEDIPVIVEKAQNASSMKANPVRFSDQELSEILEKTI